MKAQEFYKLLGDESYPEAELVVMFDGTEYQIKGIELDFDENTARIQVFE